MEENNAEQLQTAEQQTTQPNKASKSKSKDDDKKRVTVLLDKKTSNHLTALKNKFGKKNLGDVVVELLKHKIKEQSPISLDDYSSEKPDAITTYRKLYSDYRNWHNLDSSEKNSLPTYITSLLVLADEAENDKDKTEIYRIINYIFSKIDDIFEQLTNINSEYANPMSVYEKIYKIQNTKNTNILNDKINQIRVDYCNKSLELFEQKIQTIDNEKKTFKQYYGYQE